MGRGAAEVEVCVVVVVFAFEDDVFVTCAEVEPSSFLRGNRSPSAMTVPGAPTLMIPISRALRKTNPIPISPAALKRQGWSQAPPVMMRSMWL